MRTRLDIDILIEWIIFSLLHSVIPITIIFMTYFVEQLGVALGSRRGHDAERHASSRWAATRLGSAGPAERAVPG